MKYFLDTEFDEATGRITLISIGIVSEDGKRRFYAENADYYTTDKTDPWVMENVLPKLRYWGKPWSETASALTDDLNKQGQYGGLLNADMMKSSLIYFFENETPEFWGYYADYDWVIFSWIFGRMVDKPANFPYFCMDLKQKMEMYGLSEAWKNEHCPDPAGEHNALVDAEWNRTLDQAIDAYVGSLMQFPPLLRYTCRTCGNGALADSPPPNTVCGGCKSPGWALNKWQEPYEVGARVFFHPNGIV